MCSPAMARPACLTTVQRPAACCTTNCKPDIVSTASASAPHHQLKLHDKGLAGHAHAPLPRTTTRVRLPPLPSCEQVLRHHICLRWSTNHAPPASCSPAKLSLATTATHTRTDVQVKARLAIATCERNVACTAISGQAEDGIDLAGSSRRMLLLLRSSSPCAVRHTTILRSS
ncbi:hypothetical protein L1887_54047 [Cichorium endivia]|nr:hypothetical protein L1887_54047 [Cichorium endivia]